MKITLRQIEVFCAVAARGQVTRAADELAMTQAAASMALADLERQLGCVLFDRVGRRLVLSETGRLLAGRARELLDRAAEFETLARGEGGSFHLRLGASVTVGNHLLPALLVRLARRWPEARLEVARLNSSEVLAALRTHRIDAGFVEGPDADDDIRHLPWRDDRLRLFVAAGHPLAGRAVTPEALADAAFVVRERGSGTREVMARACAAAGIEPRIGFELEQPEAIRQCVKAGLGVGCLSALELEEAVAGGALACLDTPWLDMRRRIDVVLLKSRHPGAGTRALLEVCGLG